MIKEAILHMPLSQYAYAINENELVIRIRTAKNDIDSVYLYFGDRVAYVEPIPVTVVKLERTAKDDLFDYYEAHINTEYTRVCYYFLLCAGNEKLYFYSRGFDKKMDAHRTEYFQFPFIRREEVIDEPEWVADAVMYHIFPDSFASGKRELINVKETRGLVENKLGGTLRGVIENLDHIKDLGCNLIYLNPIFKANSYHKYDTIDYFDIDPLFGTKDDFKELVEKIHANGMRIILDGVFNHSGPDFFAFKDVMENQEKSGYKDWFYDLHFPLEYKDPPNYECFAYVKEMPKLNTGNPEVRKYICDVGRYWIKEFDIDGWRLDVANEVDHDTWRAFRKAVKEEKKDAFLIAEIWEDADVWLKGDQFDSAMNYTFTYLCRDFFAKNIISASVFDDMIQKSFVRYPWPVSLSQMNFLDSHDVPRFLFYCNGDKRKLQLATFYLMMAPGIPSVFYGDEGLISGDTEPEYRAPMPWNDLDLDFSDKIRSWIKTRKDHPALRYGDYKCIKTDEEGLYIFSRECKDDKVTVIINNSAKDRVVTLTEQEGKEINVPCFGGLII